jgi:hypothetical protein
LLYPDISKQIIITTGANNEVLGSAFFMGRAGKFLPKPARVENRIRLKVFIQRGRKCSL